MNSQRTDSNKPDVDVLVIGAGVMGIYQLYRAREAGFDATLVEAGADVGGVWFWNRYPQARFDSESYTYGYIFSEELFKDWKWSEHFAGQPEIEAYLNHTVDRFDLRKDMQFNTRITSAVYDEVNGSWVVGTAAGGQIRARVVIAATGGLSVPHFPEIPGLEDFRGQSHHTGLWPSEPVDFKGKKVAVVGSGPSGIQIFPIIAQEAAELTLFQRTANWATPLNNRPITDAEWAELQASFPSIQETLLNSPHGFLHELNLTVSTDFTKDERAAFFEQMWNSPGFSKLTCNYMDMTTNKDVNREWCEFIAEKIRSIVEDPATADNLIPKDHLYGGKRAPFENGFYETMNQPHVSLVNLKKTPMTRLTETGIETTAGSLDVDIIVWATGFDFGTGALSRMNVVGRDGLRLEEHWDAGPTTYLGFTVHGFPNLFFPGGPHGAGGGNYPRYGSDQVDFITDSLVHLRDSGETVFEAPLEAEAQWMDMVNTLAPHSMFSKDHSHYYGANIPGKPRRFLLNPGGRGKLHEMMAAVVDSDYRGFLSTPANSLEPATAG
ncbi:flavin-containing monooxygenase [Tomitella biformata]|uniref:flavin-containing monooxygenase n=1 Tax=Tomitella biformata TaxID=630403 RepID=UPI000464C14A|nr:NAD(P)/FAD-dependent oxidoreductase [Tomitella biformata]